MTRKELMELAESYKARLGFKPGSILVGVDSDESILELMADCYDKDGLALARADYEKMGRKAFEKYRILGMPLLVSPDFEGGVSLVRQSGSSFSMKPQGMDKAYMPVADITNAMPVITKAALSFFDEAEGDELVAMTMFAKGLAELQNNKGSWEDEGLPKLEHLLDALSKKAPKAYVRFTTRFVSCVLDFHWHCRRIKPGEEACDMELLEKNLKTAVMLRSIPGELRSEVVDALHTYGTMPDLLERLVRP